MHTKPYNTKTNHTKSYQTIATHTILYTVVTRIIPYDTTPKHTIPPDHSPHPGQRGPVGGGRLLQHVTVPEDGRLPHLPGGQGIVYQDTAHPRVPRLVPGQNRFTQNNFSSSFVPKAWAHVMSCDAY